MTQEITALPTTAPAYTLGLVARATVAGPQDLAALRGLARDAHLGGVLADVSEWADFPAGLDDAFPEGPVVYVESAQALPASLPGSVRPAAELGPWSSISPGDASAASPTDTLRVAGTASTEQVATLIRSHPEVATFVVDVRLPGSTTDLAGLWPHVLSITVGHVGINTADAPDALSVAGTLAGLFHEDIAEKPGAYFVGDIAEVVKGSFLGTHGHIALNTPRPDAAAALLEREGVALREDTRATDDDGHLIVVYLHDEVAGFALHLRSVRPDR